MRYLVLTLALLSGPAYGQLTIADKYEPFKPIVAGCNCIVPESGTVQFMWQVDSACTALASDDNKKLYIWAPPGSHNVEAVVAVTVFQMIDVWVPDPMFPNDITKAQLKKIKTLVSFDVQRYAKTYTVESPGPGPGPVPPPGPGPGPGPLDDFATQALAWLKAVPGANYTKEKAYAVSDVYASIAAEGAANPGYDLNAFVNRTKQQNLLKMSTDDLSAWTQPFFYPLAQYQSKLFNDRKLTTTDTAGIVQLWKDTAAAIKTAADAKAASGHMITIGNPLLMPHLDHNSEQFLTVPDFINHPLSEQELEWLNRRNK